MATTVAKLVRHLSAADLRLYFAFRNIDTADIDWQAAEAPLRKAAIGLIDALPEPLRMTVFVDAKAVVDLADDAGQLAMMDAVTNRGAMLAAFEEIDSAEGRSLWLFINDPEAFKRASVIRCCDRLREGRSWSGFVAPAGGQLDLSKEKQLALSEACAEAYRKLGGFRGAVEVEVFDRLASWRDEDGEGSVTQITIYTEDWPLSLPNFADDGLQRQLYRPASEVHITYCAADGGCRQGWALHQEKDRRPAGPSPPRRGLRSRRRCDARDRSFTTC